MKKYLVVKGWEGFADRLQCLSYAVTTSLRYNRILYVDWNDDIWGMGFYRYFRFDNLDYITDHTVIPKNATVTPGFWKHKLMLPNNVWVYDEKDRLQFDPITTTEFTDVWVQSGIGYRMYNMPLLCKHLRLNVDIIDSVYSDPYVDMPVVHLRGTDRTFSEQDYLRLLSVAPVAHVVSDDKQLIDRWLSDSPDSNIISDPSANVNHFSTDVDKHDMNIKLLREFFIIASAKAAYTLNNNSCLLYTSPSPRD